MLIFKDGKLIYGRLEEGWVGYNQYNVTYIGSSFCGLLERMFRSADGTVTGMYGSKACFNINGYNIYGGKLDVYKEYVIEQLSYGAKIVGNVNEWTQIFDTKIGKMIVDVECKISLRLIHDAIDKDAVNLIIQLLDLIRLGRRYVKNIDIVRYLTRGSRIDVIQKLMQESIAIESIVSGVPSWVLNFNRITQGMQLKSVKIEENRLVFMCKCGFSFDLDSGFDTKMCGLCRELYDFKCKVRLSEQLSELDIKTWREMLERWERVNAN